MATFRGRELPCRCLKPSRTVGQLSCVLFVLGASFAVLFLVMNLSDQLACDYTDVIDTCDEQPFYRTEDERANSLLNFGSLWMMKAQELRNETEKLKCEIETEFMEDLTLYHHAEATKIVQRCHAAFQACVDDVKVQQSWTTTTTTITTTSTIYVAEVITTRDRRSECQAQAEASGAGHTTYLDCITALDAPVVATTPAPSVTLQQDCTRCNSFCRSFNWTQLDPQYATSMNFSNTCGPKVCPWLPECGAGDNIHRNCSAKGCPCKRATCLGTSTLAPSGGRRLQDATTTTAMAAQVGTRKYVPYTTTTTYESLENNTDCTCKPGLVDTVLVGRPFKVFFGDPASMIRRRRTSGEGGRRLSEEEDAEIEQIEERLLQSMYADPKALVAHLQGVHVEMEEEIIVGRERHFNCRNYFSDRYKYVWPRTVGDIHSVEAMIARMGHPDLGCGYQGDFKVTCQEHQPGDGNDNSTSCSYKVDISTCEPPAYEKAVESCYKEESWTAGQGVAPEVKPFLEVEDLNFSTGTVEDAHDIPAFDQEQCCEVHVGSECVENFNYPGTVDGVWDPEKSYLRQVGYFPRVACSKQGKLRHRSCPRVKINKISRAGDDPLVSRCRSVCNLTSAREELEDLCVQDPSTGTYEREKKAQRDKIASMTAKRAELEQWSRQQWPLVGQTQRVLDCVAEEQTRRFNMVGWHASQTGDDMKELIYECRLHGCTANQCVKVTRKCDIPQMEAAPEAMCGPYGDQNSYMCMDKLPFNSWGVISRPVGFTWLALSAVFFLGAFVSIFSEMCLRRNARVHPHRNKLALQDEVMRCNKCNGELDSDAIGEGSYTCTKCVLESRLPDVCPNCGEEYEDPEDEFCTNCRQPRAMRALIDGNACLRCGEPMDIQDAKCLECGWRPEDAIVVKADMGPLRATANSAANERRIATVDVQSMHNIVGLE